MQLSVINGDNYDRAAVAGRRPVLVPVDFSSCSRAALSFAANFVRCVHAPLLVLHVVHEAGDEAGFYRSNGATGMLLPLEDVAGKMLKDFVGEVLQADDLESLEKRVSLILVSGVPVSRIREVAERERAALIVMGTHGRVGLARLTRGSVAHDVAHQTRVPVTIVKAPEEYGPDADPVTSTDWWFNAGPVRPEPDTTELRAAT